MRWGEAVEAGAATLLYALLVLVVVFVLPLLAGR